MLRIITAILLTVWTNTAFTQTSITKAVPLNNIGKIELDFTWPELITIQGWDKNEIKIEGSVAINQGQNDEAFKLKVQESDGSLKISSYIENHDRLPKKILIRKNGEEHFFNTDDKNAPEIVKYREENGSSFDYMSHGVIKDISLTIYVPTSILLDAYCEYGLIELRNLSGELSAASKYGGIDISVNTLDKKLKVGTRFGEKYSNLSQDLTSITFGDHPGEWDWISYGTSKNSEIQELQSEFGNIYIRKGK